MKDIAAATFVRDFRTNAWKWVTMFIKHHGKILLKEVVINIYNQPFFLFISEKNRMALLIPSVGLVEKGDMKNVTPMFTTKLFDKFPMWHVL